jgi:hypothetical protein
MHLKLRVGALASMLALLILASDASALRSIEIRGAERGVARSGEITFNEVRLEALTRITCNITLLRTLNSAIPKTAGAIIGKVTGVAIDQGTPTMPHCRRGGGITELREITPLSDSGTPGNPHTELGNGIQLWVVTGGAANLWNLVYESFLGMLPNITGISWYLEHIQLQIKMRVLFEARDLTCLYDGRIYGLTEVRERVIQRSRITLERTEIGTETVRCFRPLKMSGDLRSTPELSIALL